MNQQHLRLDNDTAAWRLDDETRAVGRRGVSNARAALAQACPLGQSQHSLAA
ncbi:MAG: hypothetical protein ACR2O6_12845 [Ilumatobacteraceae bacterium]